MSLQDLFEGLAFTPIPGSKQCGSGETILNVTGNQPVTDCRTVQCVSSNGSLGAPSRVGPLIGTPCTLSGGREGVCQGWVCADKQTPDVGPKCDSGGDSQDDTTVEIIVDIVEKITSVIEQLRKLFGF